MTYWSNCPLREISEWSSVSHVSKKIWNQAITRAYLSEEWSVITMNPSVPLPTPCNLTRAIKKTGENRFELICLPYIFFFSNTLRQTSTQLSKSATSNRNDEVGEISNRILNVYCSKPVSQVTSFCVERRGFLNLVAIYFNKYSLYETQMIQRQRRLSTSCRPTKNYKNHDDKCTNCIPWEWPMLSGLRIHSLGCTSRERNFWQTEHRQLV